MTSCEADYNYVRAPDEDGYRPDTVFNPKQTPQCMQENYIIDYINHNKLNIDKKILIQKMNMELGPQGVDSFKQKSTPTKVFCWFKLQGNDSDDSDDDFYKNKSFAEALDALNQIILSKIQYKQIIKHISRQKFADNYLKDIFPALHDQWIVSIWPQEKIMTDWTISDFFLKTLPFYLWSYFEDCNTKFKKHCFLIHFVIIFHYMVCPVMNVESIYNIIWKPFFIELYKTLKIQFKDYDPQQTAERNYNVYQWIQQQIATIFRQPWKSPAGHLWSPNVTAIHPTNYNLAYRGFDKEKKIHEEEENKTPHDSMFIYHTHIRSSVVIIYLHVI